MVFKAEFLNLCNTSQFEFFDLLPLVEMRECALWDNLQITVIKSFITKATDEKVIFSIWDPKD
jgi:hypothetical protein